MGANLFDSLDGTAGLEDGQARWTARAPYRPEAGFDLMLVPRIPDPWGQPESRRALAEIESLPWVAAVEQSGDAVRLRLADEWIEARGAELEQGAEPNADADLAAGDRYAVYFWGANTTKALHIRPPPQPGDRQRARPRSRPGRGGGRAPQPDLRRRPAAWGRRWPAWSSTAARPPRRGPRSTRRATTSSAIATPTT